MPQDRFIHSADLSFDLGIGEENIVFCERTKPYRDMTGLLQFVVAHILTRAAIAVRTRRKGIAAPLLSPVLGRKNDFTVVLVDHGFEIILRQSSRASQECAQKLVIHPGTICAGKNDICISDIQCVIIFLHLMKEITHGIVMENRNGIWIHAACGLMAQILHPLFAFEHAFGQNNLCFPKIALDTEAVFNIKGLVRWDRNKFLQKSGEIDSVQNTLGEGHTNLK